MTRNNERVSEQSEKRDSHTEERNSAITPVHMKQNIFVLAIRFSICEISFFSKVISLPISSISFWPPLKLWEPSGT